MSKRYRYTDRVADEAAASADKAPTVPRDRALVLAAEAKARGDMAGYARFMAVVRRSVA